MGLSSFRLSSMAHKFASFFTNVLSLPSLSSASARFLTASIVALVVWSAAAPEEARAQVPYEVVHSEGTWTPLTGATAHEPVAYAANIDKWDEGAVEIDLPFTFHFFGRPFTRVFAFTNGFLSFDPPPSGAGVLRPPSAIPSPSNVVHNFIGVMWQDLTNLTEPDGSGTTSAAAIRSQVVGSPGSRVMTLEWTGFVRYRLSGSSAAFQIRLYETSSRIEVILGPNALIANASSGIENGDGTDGQSLFLASATCNAACVCAPGDCGSAKWQPAGHTITISLPESPDLIGAIEAPPGALPGTAFDAVLRVQNVGLSNSGPFSYRLLLTDNNTSVTSPVHDFGLMSVSDVLASSELEAHRSLTMPPSLPLGAYYLALVLDEADDVLEASNTNNISFSGRMLTAPDLHATVTAPSTSGPGETMKVRVRLESLGAPTTTPIGLQFYLSTDQALDASDQAIGGPVMLAMTDGFQVEADIDLVVPTDTAPSPPPLYVMAEVDPGHLVPEVDETNNLAVSRTTTSISLPDVAVDSFSAPDFGFVGRPYPMTITVANHGGAIARDIEVCAFLSDSIVINAFTDPCIAKAGPITLAPGDVERVTIDAPLSTEPTCNDVAATRGSFFVAAVVDCNDSVLEANETNNVSRRPDRIVVRDPAPDFVPTSITSVANTAAGEALPLQARIANLGNLPGETRIRFVMSANPGITTSDLTLDAPERVFSIAPPEEASYAAWVPIPSTLHSGVYYAGVLVDPANEVDEVHEDNNALATEPIVVAGSGLAIVSPSPPPALIGVPYTRGFSAVGGLEPYVWSLEWLDGEAATGLTFDSDRAELDGVPSVEGEGLHNIRVRVTSGALSTEMDYGLIVMAPTVDLTVVSSRLPPALAGEAYSVPLVAVGGLPPYRWYLEDAGVPVGMALSADGALGGEPQLIGAYNFTVTVEDDLGRSSSKVLSLDVVGASASISIDTADVADATAGRPYTMVFHASLGTPPYVWSYEGQAIPGVTFDAARASLTGTPTVAGDYPMVVQVTDARELIDRNAYVLHVLEAGALRIEAPASASGSSGLPMGTVGKPYLASDGSAVQLKVISSDEDASGEGEDGSSTFVWSLLDGELPTGLSLERETGRIVGVPTEEGAKAFIVQVRDPHNDVARATLVVEIASDAITPPGSGGTGCGCSSMNAAEEDHGTGVWMWLSLLGLVFFGARWAIAYQMRPNHS